MINIQARVKWVQLPPALREKHHSPGGGNLESKAICLSLVPCLGPNQMDWLLSVSFLFHEKEEIISPSLPKVLHKCSGHVSPAPAAPGAFPSVHSHTISSCPAQRVWKRSCVRTQRVLLLSEALGLFWQFGFVWNFIIAMLQFIYRNFVSHRWLKKFSVVWCCC